MNYDENIDQYAYNSGRYSNQNDGAENNDYDHTSVHGSHLNYDNNYNYNNQGYDSAYVSDANSDWESHYDYGTG